jgi:hypothetical protein
MRQLTMLGMLIVAIGFAASCASGTDVEDNPQPATVAESAGSEHAADNASNLETNDEGDESIDLDSYQFVLRGYCTVEMIGTPCSPPPKRWCGPPGPACKCKTVC